MAEKGATRDEIVGVTYSSGCEFEQAQTLRTVVNTFCSGVGHKRVWFFQRLM